MDIKSVCVCEVYIYIKRMADARRRRGERWRLGGGPYREARWVKLSHNFTQTPPKKP